jgi:acetyl esterase/lipase
MKKVVIVLLLIAGAAQAQQVIHLIPGSELPKLTVFRPTKAGSKGTAVIICPGGGYGGRSDEGEGVKPAKKLKTAGITAFLLDYRLPEGNDTIPLHDARLALRYLRAHAKTFHIDPAKIGMMGFSAGGHLVATAGTHFTNAIDRPDFMIMAYPVISMINGLTHQGSRDNLLGPHPDTAKVILYSDELQVTDQTPGTFITHAMDDPGVPVNNSLYFDAALLQHHVPVRLFLYAHGGHAFDIENQSAKVQWIDDCIDWIKNEDWKKKNESYIKPIK